MESRGTPRLFVFVDIAGFSALTEAHGDAAAANLVDEFGRLLREFSAASGRIIKMIGDGALAVFDEAESAVAFADALISETERMPGRPGVKVGMHYGTTVESNGDYVGHAVNVAARVAAQAQSCQVLVTAVVRERFPEAGSVGWQSIGACKLKNIAEPVLLFLLVREQCDFVVDPVCRMRLAESEGITMETDGVAYRFCPVACADLFRAQRASS